MQAATSRHNPAAPIPADSEILDAAAALSVSVVSSAAAQGGLQVGLERRDRIRRKSNAVQDASFWRDIKIFSVCSRDGE